MATLISMIVNLTTPSNTSSSPFIANRFTDRSNAHVQECAHCHMKGHTKEKCYKLIVYPLEHPAHPNNKGKCRFPQNNKFQKLDALQVSQSSAESTNAVPNTDNNDGLSTKMVSYNLNYIIS